MTTMKTRISISLDKHAYEVLGRLAKANRQPMSRIVTELLVATLPYLERAVVVVEQAAKLKGGGLSADLQRSLAKAEREAMGHAGMTLGKVDLLLEQETERLARSSADAQRRPAPAPTPVPSNHGGQVEETGGLGITRASRTGGLGITKASREGPPVALGRAIAKAVKKGRRR